MRRYALVTVFALSLLALATGALAQIAINPTIVEFTPSPDHTATDLAGSPILTSYQFDAVAMNTLGAVALTKGLGKPTANAQGLIVVVVPELSTLTPNTLYTATVTAIGPAGSAVSAPSNPFGRVVPVAPSAATGVKIR